MWEPYVEDRDRSKQCNHCWKPRSEGIVLRKCARCKSAQYCSRECQKAAWPNHKLRCEYDEQNNGSASGRQATRQKEVWNFVGKYRNILAEAGIKALQLSRDYEVCLRSVLYVRLERHPERRFVATVSDAMPLRRMTDLTDGNYDTMNAQLKQANDDAVGSGLLGAFFIQFEMVDDGGRVLQYATIPFDQTELDAFPPEKCRVWRVELFAAMNGDEWMSSIAGKPWEDLKRLAKGTGDGSTG